jgi:hypothetical protein
MPQIGNVCQFPEFDAKDWQSLPLSRIRCQTLAATAALPPGRLADEARVARSGPPSRSPFQAAVLGTN